MQHDTSRLPASELAGRRVTLIASLLYLRYCKRRYLKFYRAFDRFKMKCFFHQALRFWGYAARRSASSTTPTWRGCAAAGATAVIVPEMEAFAQQYGFVFRCHALQASRSQGRRRDAVFGRWKRTFFPAAPSRAWRISIQQALEWSTVRMENGPKARPG